MTEGSQAFFSKGAVNKNKVLKLAASVPSGGTSRQRRTVVDSSHSFPIMQDPSPVFEASANAPYWFIAPSLRVG